MSDDSKEQQPKKQSNLERERAIYAKLGMRHPKDIACDFGLRYFKKMMQKQGRTRNAATTIPSKNGENAERIPGSPPVVPRTECS